MPELRPRHAPSLVGAASVIAARRGVRTIASRNRPAGSGISTGTVASSGPVASARPAAALGEVSRSARQRRIGNLLDFKLPPGARHMRLELKGPIGERDASGQGIFAWEIEARLEANQHVQTILVELDSPGGLVSPAERIHDALVAHPAHVTVLVTGLCASAAIDILLAADWRAARPDARFYIHGTASGSPNPPARWTAESHAAQAAMHAAQAEMLALSDEHLLNRLVECLGGPRFRYEELLAQESLITARDAKAVWLLINEISAR